jgi:hypothetical protein
MKKQNTIYSALVTILITSLACNLGGTAPGSNGVTPIAILEQESSAVTLPAITEPVETAPTAIPEPLPSGYMELLQNKIASGEWTQEEGLVTLLKMFVGEIQVSEADLGQGVLNTEGTGILQWAGYYLQIGTDQAAKDEITRLINLIVPSQESLDRFSIPEEQAFGRGPGLAATTWQDSAAAFTADRSYQTEENCKDLWVGGFPDPRLPSFPCFQFRDLGIAGNHYKVYYPLAWREDASKNSYYLAALQAIQKTIAQYKTYGEVKSIYFVFSTLNAGRFDALTYYNSFTATIDDIDALHPDLEACPIVIMPSALNDPAGESFQQLIAHEIFHCFQAWNLNHQLIGPGNDSTWWREGSAEYFSNVVYPAVNNEHQHKNAFSRKSTTVPLMEMDYENFAFFQFLGNRIDPEGVIAMLRTMPITPGRVAQITALAAVPGMEDTFEEFVQAIMDNTLEDTDESVIEFEENFTNQFYFNVIGSKDFSGKPFVVARYQVGFPNKKSIVFETTSSDGGGRSAWHLSELVGEWEPLSLFPTDTVGGCDELLYKLYVITTIPGTERTSSIAATMITEIPCGSDECLIGRWEATNDSVISYMQSVVDKGGDNVPTVKSVTGIMFMEFGADSIGSGGYENLKVHETGVGGVASTEVFVTFNGFSSGPYAANGSALTGLSETADIVVTVQIPSVGSTTVPFKQEDFPVSTGVPTRYTCEGDTLTMWPPADGAAPIIYIRTSP